MSDIKLLLALPQHVVLGCLQMLRWPVRNTLLLSLVLTLFERLMLGAIPGSDASESPIAQLQEMVFGWPFSEYERQVYSVQAHRVLEAVGLKQIPVATPLQQLSGGFKRRVALAVQLVRRPTV